MQQFNVFLRYHACLMLISIINAYHLLFGEIVEYTRLLPYLLAFVIYCELYHQTHDCIDKNMAIIYIASAITIVNLLANMPILIYWYAIFTIYVSKYLIELTIDFIDVCLIYCN